MAKRRRQKKADPYIQELLDSLPTPESAQDLGEAIFRDADIRLAKGLGRLPGGKAPKDNK
jgi:hypothetical protein